MSLVSTTQSKVNDIRFVPPNEEASPDNNNGKAHSSRASTPEPHQKPRLWITSYDRFTPANPKPDLEYDCRTTANPPAQARREHTGIDDEMQEELMNRNDFSDLISRAEEEIRRLMEVKHARAGKEGEDTAVLRVGCLCGSGHHRSVAFAEQLGKIAWPNDWEVDVQHRDLTDGLKEHKEEQQEQREHREKMDEVYSGHREI